MYIWSGVLVILLKLLETFSVLLFLNLEYFSLSHFDNFPTAVIKTESFKIWYS